MTRMLTTTKTTARLWTMKRLRDNDDNDDNDNDDDKMTMTR